MNSPNLSLIEGTPTREQAVAFADELISHAVIEKTTMWNAAKGLIEQHETWDMLYARITVTETTATRFKNDAAGFALSYARLLEHASHGETQDRQYIIWIRDLLEGPARILASSPEPFREGFIPNAFNAITLIRDHLSEHMSNYLDKIQQVEGDKTIPIDTEPLIRDLLVERQRVMIQVQMLEDMLRMLEFNQSMVASIEELS